MVTEIEEEVEEIPSIRENFVRLGNLDSAADDRSYNVVAVIVNIFNEREIQKADRTLILEGIKIGDPLTQRTLDVSIWNRQVRLSAEMIGQSFLFKNFKLTRYKEQPNLQSIFRSEIVRHSFFDEFEGKHISYGAQTKTHSGKLKLIREVSDEVRTMGNETLFSEVRARVTRIGFDRKWFYLACGKCKKAVGEGEHCSNCECPTSQAVKRYILQVELADSSGSLWATSFEEAALCFLGDTPVEELSCLGHEELEAVGNSSRYEQDYLLTVSSRRHQLSVKHSVMGRPHRIDEAQQAKHNLKRIAQLLND